MQKELVKVRPTPNHFHKEGQVVCERCMSQFASSGNQMIDALHEYFYVTAQLTRICLEGAFYFLISLSRLIAKGILRLVRGSRGRLQSAKRTNWHVHTENQQVCEECIASFTSSGSTLVDGLKEHVHTVHEILLIIAKFVLFVSMGLGMLVAALFPAIVGRKTAYEEELDSRYKARKQQEWERLQQDKREAQSYDEERDAQFRAHHEKLRALKGARAEWSESQFKSWQKERNEAYSRDEKNLEEYEKNRRELMGPNLGAPKIFMGTELAEDDYLVNSINNTIKGIENGTDDPEKLRKISEDLIKQREDTAKKDARRRELLDKSREKDAKANRLFVDADKAYDKGESDEGDRLRDRAYKARSDAAGLYNQAQSI